MTEFFLADSDATELLGQWLAATRPAQALVELPLDDWAYTSLANSSSASIWLPLDEAEYSFRALPVTCCSLPLEVSKVTLSDSTAISILLPLLDLRVMSSPVSRFPDFKVEPLELSKTLLNLQY